MYKCEKNIDCLECDARAMCTSYANFKSEQGYNKGIQDFYDKVLNFEDYIEPLIISNGGNLQLYSGKDITKMIAKIKEELVNK